MARRAHLLRSQPSAGWHRRAGHVERKVLLYWKQFGGELTLIPDEWVQSLAGIREFL
jgi:hypothetical protein